MAISNLSGRPHSAAYGTQGPAVALGACSVLLLAGAALAFGAYPAIWLLPLVSVGALVLALAVAAVAWFAPARQDRRPTYWDVAGMLTFVGMSAAMLSEPSQLVALFETGQRHR